MASVIPNIERIRELQEPYSQMEFCAKCGISRQALTRIYNNHKVIVDTLKAIAAAFPEDVVDFNDLILPEPTETHLCDRISRLELWPEIENAARSIAIISGTAAMRTYSAEARSLLGFSLGSTLEADTASAETLLEKNPMVPADLDAMVSGIQTADMLIRPIADRLVCGVSYLSEELTEESRNFKDLLGAVASRVHGPRDFFQTLPNTLRVLADPLDGSVNHKRGIPMFCSAVALLIEDQPRVCAIYDPVHNIVYSASLAGSYDKPDKQATATAWDISSGHTVDLVDLSIRQKMQSLRSEAIAIHIPRKKKDRDKREHMLGKLPFLLEQFDSVYVLNAGIPAMVLVAKGGLAAFANPLTNLHDVAAGEVLCRACRCSVKTLDGESIRYSKLDTDDDGNPIAKTSLFAARKDLPPDVRDKLQLTATTI